MFATCLLNSGSLVFGITAWVLPVIGLIRLQKADTRKRSVFSVASLAACAVSLCLQIFELHHRVGIQDWSALLDTSRAVAWAAVLLVIVTVILNVVALAKCIERQPKN